MTGVAMPPGRPELLRALGAVAGDPAEYGACVDGTAVPSRRAGAGIEFPGGIRLTAGQTLTLAAR